MVGISTGRASRALRADINVTPLVDVVLVLLIIFMVITPLLRASHALQLPAARAGLQSASAREPLVLSVAADGGLWLQDKPVPNAQLGAMLAARQARHDPTALLIRADVSLSMRDLRPLLRQIKAAGLHQIAFAVAPGQGAR
jgi:biopolymer transport protein ExbD